MSVFNRLTTLFIFVSLVLGFATRATAQDAKNEFAIKSAYLYRIMNYVDWKSIKGDQIVIGVFGKTEGGQIIIPAGKLVAQKTVIVKTITDVSELSSCKVVFITSAEKGKLGSILAGVKGQEILTVADSEGLMDKGVMVNFVNRNNKIVFEINVKEIKAANISMDSQLYEVANRLVN